MKTIKKYHLTLFIPLLIIMIISFLNMSNAKLINDTYNLHFLKQVIWYVIGFTLIIILNKVNVAKILNYSFYFYLFSCFLLILVLFLGRNIHGARAWFSIGPISIQPSEIMKLALALFLSKFIAEVKITNKKEEFYLILKVLIITLIPTILVFLEPDTGAIIFFFLIAITLLLASKVSKWWFLFLLIGLALLVILFYVLYTYNQDLLIKLIGTSFFYRVERLLTFTEHSSYQLENALVVMGSAKAWGTGLGKIALYIPEAPTDFIYAFTIGNFGLFTGFIVLICYFVIDLTLVKWQDLIEDKKIKLFLISFISIFFFQQLINIGMNVGFLPIIGIPLPFLSYGGSTIIIYFLFLGIILKFLKTEGTNIY